MLKLLRLILVPLPFILFGCSTVTQDGEYLVYKTENPPTFGLANGIDFRASDRMAQMFKGKRYNLQFKPEYIILREHDSNEDIILNKRVDNNVPNATYYEHEYTKGLEKVSMNLCEYLDGQHKRETTLMIVVTKLQPDSIGSLREGPWARVRCSLEKQP